MWRNKAALSIVFILTLIFASNTAFAESIGELNSKLDELEREQQELNQKSNSINSEVSETEQKIQEVQEEQAHTNEEINEIDSDLEDTQAELTAKQNEITETNNEIATIEGEIADTENDIQSLKEEITILQDEIETLEEKIEAREELLKKRLRSIQQSGGNINYLEIIFGAQNFGDFISRATAVTKIMDQDKSIMEQQQSDKEALEANKTQLEANKQELEDKQLALEENKQKLENTKATLVAQQQEINQIKATLNQQLKNKQQLLAELEHEEEELHEHKMSLAEQQETLNNQEAVIQEAKRKAKQKIEQFSGEQQNSDSSPSLSAGGSGSLIWPAQGRQSSGYGYRSFNGGGFHYGIDIANGKGTPIHATASGVVTRANYSSSYGNVVYIYHLDKNLTTVYAHLNSLGVSLGQEVSQGQQIGGMGNTGDSFGDHLHFEVHKGEWNYRSGVNPMNYLP
ncbi:M23 family metallopeptidase [Gracilibacillus sp. YIM 98692]|uniref:murein hydrolase activator EnvC family protein n=1 Tax=Gracilibacillus sp. YIM 98692 TaxID=2663532 RepID=UPI0013D3E405|nr:M23 family metallopeptidase [Gracilibacillus sp. YIM 98692]